MLDSFGLNGPISGLFVEGIEHRLDMSLQLRDVACHGLPDGAGIDLEVIVHQDVPQPDNLGPRNVRSTIPDILG